VEVLSGIEPKVKLLLSVTLSFSEYVGVEDVRISA